MGNGALRTARVALVVTAVSAVTGLLLGMAPRAGAGPTEVLSTLPAVLASLLIRGRDRTVRVGAVCVVAWSPYAAQTAALLEQERASRHIAASVALGAGRLHLLRRHLLPPNRPPGPSSARPPRWWCCPCWG